MKPEIPTAFEIGYRTAFWDRRGYLSVTAFHTTFEDFQAQVVETPPGQAIGAFAIRNAGELRSQGFEAELNVSATEFLTLGLGLAYNDAEFVSFTCAARPRGVPQAPNPACTTIGAGVVSTFDASGLAAPNAPEYTANVDARYERPLTWLNGATGFLQANAYFRDETTFGLVPRGSPNPYTQPAYMLVNASLGATFNDGGATISLFGKNILDENFVTGIFDLPFDGVGGLGQWVSRDAEQTFGVALSLRR